MLEGLIFKGTEHDEDCGKITDREYSVAARSFMRIKSPKEGLIYKFPLPRSGTTLSGSEDITERFDLYPSLAREGAKWSVKLDWNIYPENR